MKDKKKAYETISYLFFFASGMLFGFTIVFYLFGERIWAAISSVGAFSMCIAADVCIVKKDIYGKNK